MDIRFNDRVVLVTGAAQGIGPKIVARGRGRMVFVASGTGLRPSRTGIQAYTASKHALVGLTKQLSWELGPAGVTVNAVAPGEPQNSGKAMVRRGKSG